MGPLQGVRVVELAGIGAAPFGCMLLADLGAEVVRVERAGTPGARGRRRRRARRGRRPPLRPAPRPPSVGARPQDRPGREPLLRLVEQADVLVEGYRPGVTERLGARPDDAWPATRGWSTAA